MTLVGILGHAAGDVLASGAVRVALKTNLGPELEVAGGPRDGGGIAAALGIKSALIVRDAQGRELYVHGQVPATNYLLVAVLLGAVAFVGFLLVRGVLKR